MPAGYGVSEGNPYLEWSDVEARLVEGVNYWMATTRPDGRPHVVPRWGVWVDGRFWYDGSPDTRHARNAAVNPYCALHLEDGLAVTIVEGVTFPSDPITGSKGRRLSDEYMRKYRSMGYAPGPGAWSGPDAGGLRVFTPKLAIAWSEFSLDPTRFRFE